MFIHGTGFSAGRWANLINDLESDPVIRDRFPFWPFTYATGNPTSYSALLLRDAIENAVGTLDPTRLDPALQNIVLIGHSQGGLLAKYLSIDSGPRLWNALSGKPPEEMRVSPENASLLRRMFFVKPLPEIRRVIFMATPHHGSFVAEAPIGQILSQLITPNDYILSVLRDLTEDNPNALRGGTAATPFSSSLWSMSPENPLLQAFAGIPVSPRIAAHSIIAVEGDGPVVSGDDGIVSYQSAHIPEAASELVIRSGHSMQSDPKTVDEVRRILLLHLAQNCPDGCRPGAAFNTSLPMSAPIAVAQDIRQRGASAIRRLSSQMRDNPR